MLPKSRLLIAMSLLWVSLSALCQGLPGTNDDGFSVDIRTPVSIAQYIPPHNKAKPGACYWVGSTFGPSLKQDLCGEVVWAYDEAHDSTACGPIPGDLKGKIALIRRGGCTFSLKVYRAQQAGAIAVIILNHFSNAADRPCANTFTSVAFSGMPSGDSANAVVIPSVFLQRETGTQISEALENGEKVEVCFRLPRVQNAAVAYHYATPISQVVDLKDIYMEYTNRDTGAQTDIVAKVDIADPDGKVTTLTAPIGHLASGETARVWFPPYKPVKRIGKFTAKFSNNKYTEPRDTLTREFCLTLHTYATDNLTLVPGGVGFSDPASDPPSWTIQCGSLYFTGPTLGVATYISFGIANPDSIWVPHLGAEANTIMAVLYDADLNRDGVNDLSLGFDQLNHENIVGLTSVFLDGTQPVDSVFSVPLYDFLVPEKHGVILRPNNFYYLTLYYDNQAAQTGRLPKFSRTADEFYVNPLATPIYINSTRMDGEGWPNSEVIARLHLDGFSATPVGTGTPPLDPAKVEVSPNPARETLRLTVRLDAVSPTVRVRIVDLVGKVVRRAERHNFQQGTLDFDVRDLPSGTYIVAISTAEGDRWEKVAVVRGE